MRTYGRKLARMVGVGVLAVVGLGRAAVVGVSHAAPSLTVERVRLLPASEREVWLEYMARSAAQMKADKAMLAAERAGLTEIPGLPKQANSARSVPVQREAAFYFTDEALRVAGVVLSFQTPAGGWSKNLDMSGPPRQRGQSYATANLAPVSSGPGDFDEAADENWHYVGTLDNDATNTELHFLAEMAAAWRGKEGDVYRAAFLRGVEYLLRAQYPNGGWPQVWPLEGGYHDAVTFNDDVVTESAEVLRRVSEGRDVKAQGGATETYGFVPEAIRAKAKAAVAKALECILKGQVKVGGVSTVWAQQEDALTLEPVAGRNFEPAALCSGESASVMDYLLGLDAPSSEVVAAVDAAAAWFNAHEVMGYTWSGGREVAGGRALTPVEGAGPLWARYYSVTTGRPVFGDRDKTIHDDVMEISLERRNGYGWYGDGPTRVLARYAVWKKMHAGA